MNAIVHPADADNCENSVKTFNKRAQQYQQKYMDVSLYEQGLALLLDSLEMEKPNILELGCGPGNVTKHMRSLRPALNITAVDLAENMIELAKVNCPEAQYKVMDCRQIHQLDKGFDAIVCGFVLPYLSRQEVVKLFQQASELLNPGGYLYLSTMEDDYDASGMQTSQTSGDQIYIYYHQAGHLSNALQANGFSIDELHRVQQSPQADTDLVVLARKRF